MGISEAFYIPAALALIADYHTGGTRSRAVGLHQMAIYCGVNRSAGFGGYVADAPGASAGAGRLRRLRHRRDGVRRAAGAAAARRRRGRSRRTACPRLRRCRSELLTNLSFILLVLYFTLPALAGWVVRDWMPAILKQEFGIGQGKAGVVGDAVLAGRGHRRGGRSAGGSADRWMRRTTAAASSSAPSA